MSAVSRWKVEKKGKLFQGPDEVVQRNLRAGFAEVAAFGEREIKKRSPKGVTTGIQALSGSVFGEVTFFPKLIVAWGTPVFYGPIVEEGRLPGSMPPPERLRPWVEEKLGVPPEKSKGVAFVVARAIGRRGTKGQKMFAKSVPAIRRFALKEFELTTKKIADDLNR